MNKCLFLVIIAFLLPFSLASKVQLNVSKLPDDSYESVSEVKSLFEIVTSALLKAEPCTLWLKSKSERDLVLSMLADIEYGEIVRQAKEICNKSTSPDTCVEEHLKCKLVESWPIKALLKASTSSPEECLFDLLMGFGVFCRLQLGLRQFLAATIWTDWMYSRSAIHSLPYLLIQRHDQFDDLAELFSKVDVSVVEMTCIKIALRIDHKKICVEDEKRLLGSMIKSFLSEKSTFAEFYSYYSDMPSNSSTLEIFKTLLTKLPHFKDIVANVLQLHPEQVASDPGLKELAKLTLMWDGLLRFTKIILGIGHTQYWTSDQKNLLLSHLSSNDILLRLYHSEWLAECSELDGDRKKLVAWAVSFCKSIIDDLYDSDFSLFVELCLDYPEKYGKHLPFLRHKRKEMVVRELVKIVDNDLNKVESLLKLPGEFCCGVALRTRHYKVEKLWRKSN